jgi:hypothetical protein
MHERLEADIETQAVEYGLTLDYYILKLNGEGNRGKPDRLFVNLVGEHIYIEFKREDEELRADQWVHVRDLTRRGCTVYQSSNVGHAKRILDNHRSPRAEAIEGRLTFEVAVKELAKNRVEL